jgi:hypothetical protein
MNYKIDESRTSKYGVDLIGQIDANLTHLRGYGVMALELIQNADDAGATEVSLDISERALIIHNNAEFKSCPDPQSDNGCAGIGKNSEDMCDWHSFGLIASGAKSQRSVTSIGRFGLGFTSVYQITDNPEVECSGIKVIIEPDKDKIIWKNVPASEGTTFTLPWASDSDAPVRRRLKNVGVVTKDALPKISSEINETSSESLVFLKNLEKISILNNGKVKSIYTREIIPNRNTLRIIHQPTGKAREYFYVSADIANSLGFLELKFARDLGEKNRRHGIDIAIPRDFDSSKSGLIYAYLPTERSTLMPMSINGDFYPDSSRKDVILNRDSGNDAFSEWNRAIIENCADLFSQYLEEIYLFLGYKNFWKLVQSVFDLNQRIDAYGSDISNCFAAFWNKFGLKCGALPIIPIEGNEALSKSIQNAYLLEGDDVKEKREAVEILGIPAPTHRIQKHFEILKELGIEEIDFNVVIEALSKASWVQKPQEKILSSDPEMKNVYMPVYTLLESHIPRETASLIYRDSLVKYKSLPVLVTQSGRLSMPRDIYFTENSGIQNLAIEVDSQIMFLNEELMRYSRIKGSCKEFRTEDAVILVKKALDQDQAPSFPKMKKIHNLLTIIIGGKSPSDYDLENLRQLRVWPTTDGTLINAVEGMIPGDFLDPLGNADIIDVSKLEKKTTAFLVDVLKVKILSLESYVDEILPKVFSSPSNGISSDSYQRLLEELSKQHKKFESKELVSKMQSLLFIPTEYGGFSKILNCAVGSKLDKAKLSGIFESWVAADFLPDSKVVQQFLGVLGLRTTPDVRNLELALRKLTSEVQNVQNRQKVIRVLDYLIDKRNNYSDSEISTFFSLFSTTGFMPAKADFEFWYSPEDLLSPEVEDMVHSQNHLKILDLCGVEINSIDTFIQKSGVKTEPEVNDVIFHIKSCADSGIPASPRTLKFLNKAAARKTDLQTIEKLKSLRDVAFLESPLGNVRPANLYKELYKVGAPWAYVLPKTFYKFPDLIDALGIKHSPEAEDLVGILTQIRSSHLKLGASAITEDNLKGYLQCWELLNQLCKQESITEFELIELKDSSLFLNQNREFRDRDSLIIADSEWFLKEFGAEFGDYFVLDDHVFSDILEILEFRYLSENIEATLSTIEEPIIRHENLKKEISLRAGNITAALANMESSSKNSTTWTSLDVYQVKSIFVEWALSFGDEVRSVTKPGNVFADFPNRKLYVTQYLTEGDSEFNWERIFKELFDQLFPSESNENLSGSVAVVAGVMARSPERGLQYLQDIGRAITPREASIDFSEANVEEIDLNTYGDDIQSDAMSFHSDSVGGSVPQEYEKQVSEDQGEAGESSEESQTNLKIPGLKSSEHRDRNQNLSSQDSSMNHPRAETPPRNTLDRPRPTGNSQSSNSYNREIREAYIYAQREPSEEAKEVQKTKMYSESLSRKIVMEHERSEGREPEEMSGNNVGYDIESKEPNGDIRFIEVKSTKSLWGGDGITLSFSQLNLAYIKKDAFWLYVVENIGSANPRIYKIQNAAKHIRGFKLNDAWKEIAISLEHSSNHEEVLSDGISEDDVGMRILHVEHGECFLIGWQQFGSSVKVTLLFDNDDQHVVLPLNATKMKKLGA